MRDQGVLDDTLAGAGFAQHEAEAALLGMDAQDIEGLGLVGQHGDGIVVERIALKAEVRADHGQFSSWVGWMSQSLSWLGGFRLGSGTRSLASMSSGRASPMRSPL